MPEMNSFASAAAPGAASNTLQTMPPSTVTCTKPRPIAPEPTTPTFRSGLLGSNGMVSPSSNAGVRTGRETMKVRDAAQSALSAPDRSEEHTSEPQSLMRISYAVFCLKKKNMKNRNSKYKQYGKKISRGIHHTI